jgi:hypothetical protein
MAKKLSDTEREAYRELARAARRIQQIRERRKRAFNRTTSDSKTEDDRSASLPQPRETQP